MTRSRPFRSRVKLHVTSFVLLLALAAGYGTTAKGQAPATESQAVFTETTEVEVPIIGSVDSRRHGFGYCGSYSRAFGPVVTEQEFREILARSSEKSASSDKDRCAFVNRLNVDFSRHSLLTYVVNGDCFVRAAARVFQDDSSRKYVLRITTIYGGCRAAGSAEAWLIIEKLRPDYEVEVELFVRDESGRTRRIDQR